MKVKRSARKKPPHKRSANRRKRACFLCFKYSKRYMQILPCGDPKKFSTYFIIEITLSCPLGSSSFWYFECIVPLNDLVQYRWTISYSTVERSRTVPWNDLVQYRWTISYSTVERSRTVPLNDLLGGVSSVALTIFFFRARSAAASGVLIFSSNDQ